jgi:hypothetical protein
MLRATPEIYKFRASPALVEGLKTVMADPAMKEALKALDSLARPRGIPAFAPGTPHDTTIAHTYCEMAGVNTALIFLQSLCYAKDENAPADEVEDEEEFSHAVDLKPLPKHQ